MPETAERPVAVRATAFIRPSRWLHRPVRRVRYDASWAGGPLVFDVDLYTVLRGIHTSDFAAIKDTVHTHCPEVGTGRWVDGSGSVVVGPDRPEPAPPQDARGTPRKYGVPIDGRNTVASRAWRLGFGVAGLTAAGALVLGPAGDGLLGFVGVLCVISGASLLAGFLPGSRRG